MPEQTPEQVSREKINAQLAACGWAVQDYRQFHPSTARGIALREVPLKSGTCDYLLLLDRKAVGVIEAKREGTLLSGVAEQSGHYAENLPDMIQPVATGSSAAPDRVHHGRMFRRRWIRRGTATFQLSDLARAFPLPWSHYVLLVRRSRSAEAFGFYHAEALSGGWSVRQLQRQPAQEKPWTQKLWIYDLRTNLHFTLKENTLKRSDLDDFVACYNPKNRIDRKESERFKAFTYEDLVKRDKVNLDIFWLKDEALEESANLPAPEIIAQEIAADLEAALEQFASIAEDLKER